MGLEIQTGKEPEGADGPLTADRRLFLAADESTIVEDGDERAAFQLCAPGAVIGSREARRLRLRVVNGKLAQADAEPEALKEHTPAENKELTPPENKGDKGKGYFGKKKR